MRFFLLQFVCLTALAAPAPTAPVTWTEALAEATRNNPTLRAARESFEKASALGNAGYKGFLPQVSASAGYNRSNSGAATGTGEQYSMGVTATQNIFNGLKDYSTLKQAKALRDSSEWALQASKLKLQRDLKSSFAQLLYAQELQSFRTRVEKRRKDNADLVELRFEGGRENKGSMLRARAQYHQAQFEVNEISRNKLANQRQFAQLLGRDESASLVVVGKGTAKEVLAGAPDFKILVDKHPAFRQSDADKTAAEAAVTGAYGNFLPSFNLSGTVSKVGADFPPNNNRWSVDANLSIPIFDGAANIFGVRAAKADERRAVVNLESQRLQLLSSMEQRWAELKNAIDRLTIQKEFVKAVEVRAEISRSQYSTGIIRYNDWDIIENDLISQQARLYETQRDALVAEAEWDQASGQEVQP